MPIPSSLISVIPQIFPHISRSLPKIGYENIIPTLLLRTGEPEASIKLPPVVLTSVKNVIEGMSETYRLTYIPFIRG